MMRRVLIAVLLLCGAGNLAGAVTGRVVGLDGSPIAGASVAAVEPLSPSHLLRHEQATIAAATTDAKGAFTLEIAGKGVIDIAVRRDGYAPADLITAIDDPPGTIVLTKAATTEIHVLTIDGAPLAGAKVIAYGPSGGALAVTSDASGVVRMPDPQAWATRLEVLRDGFENFDIDPSQAKLTLFKLRAAPGAAPPASPADAVHVRGIVRDGENVPLRGVGLLLRGPNGWEATVTDAKGAFDFTVPRGRYTLDTAAPAPYPISAVSIDASNGDVARDVAAPVKLTAVDGRVVRGDGTPVAFWRIEGSKGEFNTQTGIFSSSAGTFRVYLDPATLSLIASSRQQLESAPAAIRPSPVKIVVDSATIVDRAKKPVIRHVTVRGHIVNAEGKPMIGERVAIGDRKGQSYDGGEFQIDWLKEGVYTIRFGPYLSQEQQITAPSDDVKLVLSQTRKLRGRVVDATSGAAVTKFAVNMQPIESPKGEFDIEIDRRQPISVMASGYHARESIAVQEWDEDFVVELTKGRTIRGRVVDEQRRPIAGVAVSSGSESTESSAEGRYEIVATEPILFAKSGFVSSMIRPDGEDDPHTIDLTMKRGITVSGTVFDKSGAVVADAEVSASSATGPAPQSVQTDAGGGFRFDDLAEGRYDFVAERADPPGRGTARDVDVKKSGPIRIVMERPETAAIFGHVSGVAPGAAEIIVIAASADQVQSATADAAGDYLIPNAPAGKIEVRALAMGGSKSSPVSLETKPGSETRVDLSVAKGARVHGIVKWGAVEAVGFTVSLGDSSAVTNSDGTYGLTVAPGEYDVTVTYLSPPQKFPFSRHVSVTGDMELNLKLDTTGIDVKVIDADTKAPVANARVSIVTPNTNEAELTLLTRGDGTIDLPAAADRPITLRVRKDGYASLYKDLTPQKDEALTVELKRVGATLVRLVDARDGTALIGSVVVRDLGGRYVAAQNIANADDLSYHVDLLPGTYQFSASAESYGSVTMTAEVPAPEPIRVPLPRGGSLMLRSSIDLKATVRLIQPNGQPYVRCWCNGVADVTIAGRSALVDRIAPGRYTLEVTPAGGKARRFPVTVKENQTTAVNID